MSLQKKKDVRRSIFFILLTNDSIYVMVHTHFTHQKFIKSLQIASIAVALLSWIGREFISFLDHE